MTKGKHHSNSGRHDRHTTQRHKGQHKKHLDNPCPHRPKQLDGATQLVGVFEKHPGHKRHNRWTMRTRWTEVRHDADGFPIIVTNYDVEIELSANGTDWFVASRHTVTAKDDGDDGNKDHLVVHHIHGNLAYRFRVRAVGNNCKAEWSTRYVVGTPEDVPPAPFDVRILRSSHGIRLRWHVNPHAIDDQLFTEDIAYFVSELWTNPDFGPSYTFTATASNDTFTHNNHGFNDGDPVMVNSPVGGTLPDGVKPWKMYLVDAKTTNTFKLVHEEDLSTVALTSDGSGTVHWGLVRKARHIHHHHHPFRLDVDDFDEDTRFYGRVLSVADHHTLSAWMPATAPLGNSDPDATPTGRRPAWHRHVFTWTIIGNAQQGVYVIPTRSDDDYRIRRVNGAFHNAAGGGGPTRFNIKINADTFVFGTSQADMMKINDGERDGSSKQIHNGAIERGDHMRLVVDSIEGTAPANGTVDVVCDRRHDGSTTDSGGGGGDGVGHRTPPTVAATAAVPGVAVAIT